MTRRRAGHGTGFRLETFRGPAKITLRTLRTLRQSFCLGKRPKGTPKGSHVPFGTLRDACSWCGRHHGRLVITVGAGTSFGLAYQACRRS